VVPDNHQRPHTPPTMTSLMTLCNMTTRTSKTLIVNDKTVWRLVHLPLLTWRLHSVQYSVYPASLHCTIMAKC